MFWRIPLLWLVYRPRHYLLFWPVFGPLFWPVSRPRHRPAKDRRELRGLEAHLQIGRRGA